MRGRKNQLVVLVLMLHMLVGAYAKTWYIHPDSSLNSIQAGLDSCTTDDSVFVGAGIYYENLAWPAAQGIKLVSEYGRDTTIIDGDSIGDVIYIHVLVDSTTVIHGFTIQNGFGGYWGGGIYCDGLYVDSCSPQIINNKLTGNHGAGISCCYSSPYIIDNIIYGNASGISCYASFSPAIIGNTISENTSSAINLDLSGGDINYNIMIDNGYGVICTNAGGNFYGDVIKDNHGVGISLYDSYPTLNHCTISNNDGDGLEILATLSISPIINYNNIVGNTGYGIRYEWYIDVIIDAQYNW